MFKLFKRRPNLIMSPLEADDVAQAMDIAAADVSHKQAVIVPSGQQVCLLYRDDQFLGIPCPHGGNIYPFSANPTRKGTAKQKKQYTHARFVCVKTGLLRLYWGTPEMIHMTCPVTHELYRCGANGVFYVTVEVPHQLCSRYINGQNQSVVTIEQMQDFFSMACLPLIHGVIEEYVTEHAVNLNSFEMFTPLQKIEISEAACQKISDTFRLLGMTLNTDLSARSLVTGIHFYKAD